MKLPNIFENQVPLESYTAGAIIFPAGAPGNSMYIVCEGEVELRLENGLVVEVVEADGFFGEMALIEQKARSAAAVARTDCKVRSISQEQFMFMVEETPFFAIEVMRKMSARLRLIDSRQRGA